MSNNTKSPLKFEPCSWRGVLDATLYDTVCQWPATSRWFFSGAPVSSTNKTDRHDITENIIESVAKHHNPKPKSINTMCVTSTIRKCC
jgi:hypothetical protein